MGIVDKALITPVIRQLGYQDYRQTWQAMQDFTRNRNATTSDEIWVVEHPPVYTLGRNGKRSHILTDTHIPVIKVDRGGQVTYHGPGQLVIYILLDLHRRKLGIRQLVTHVENAIIQLLTAFDISANSDPQAPGVYVHHKKIAALGLRVSKGCTTHGLSLNVDMDLTPFNDINPCGYAGLQVTQCRDLGIKNNMASLSSLLIQNLVEQGL